MSRTEFCNRKIDFELYPSWSIEDLKTFMGWNATESKLIYPTRPEVMSSRGCPYHCHFCHNTEKTISRFSSKRTADNVQLLVSLGAPEIFFKDDIFTMNVGHMMAIYDELFALGVDIRGRNKFFTHVNFVKDHTLRAMQRFDPKEIQIGIESGDDAMLVNMGKKFTSRAAFDALRRLSEARLTVYPLFLIGFPGESRESLDHTLAFIRAAKPFLKSGVWVSYYQPTPKSVGYELAKRRNPNFVAKRNEDITYVDPNLTREILTEYRQAMMTA